MTKQLPNSVTYAINPSFLPLVRQIMVELLGKDRTTCEMCGSKPKGGCAIHHTKYEGATIFDLMFVCTKCNNQAENRGLA